MVLHADSEHMTHAHTCAHACPDQLPPPWAQGAAVTEVLLFYSDVCASSQSAMWVLTRTRPGASQAGALLRTLANWATVDPAAISGKNPATCQNIGMYP